MCSQVIKWNNTHGKMYFLNSPSQSKSVWKKIKLFFTKFKIHSLLNSSRCDWHFPKKLFHVHSTHQASLSRVVIVVTSSWHHSCKLHWTDRRCLQTLILKVFRKDILLRRLVVVVVEGVVGSCEILMNFYQYFIYMDKSQDNF